MQRKRLGLIWGTILWLSKTKKHLLLLLHQDSRSLGWDCCCVWGLTSAVMTVSSQAPLQNCQTNRNNYTLTQSLIIIHLQAGYSDAFSNDLFTRYFERYLQSKFLQILLLDKLILFPWYWQDNYTMAQWAQLGRIPYLNPITWGRKQATNMNTLHTAGIKLHEHIWWTLHMLLHTIIIVHLLQNLISTCF
jgi:hypothetical protein